MRHLFVTMGILAFVSFAAAEAGEHHLVADPGAWHMERTWKSAHAGPGGGARYHFYSGTFGLRNVGEADLENVRAVIRLIDPGGRLIQETPPIRCGDLAKGESLKQPFSMDKAVQFAEFVLAVTFSIDNEEKTVRFSTTSPETCPTRVEVDKTGLVNDLRVLSAEIDQPILGRKKKPPMLVVRVRNLSSVPASDPVAKLILQAKVKTRKGYKTLRKEIEVPLEKGEVPPGETRAYRKRLGKLPEYHGYAVTVSATWPEREVVIETAPTEFEAVGAQSADGVQIGALEAKPQEGGKLALSVEVTNKGEAIAAGKLKMTFIFKDAKGEEVARFTHACAQTIPAGETVRVDMPARELPAYAGYEIGIEF